MKKKVVQSIQSPASTGDSQPVPDEEYGPLPNVFKAETALVGDPRHVLDEEYSPLPDAFKDNPALLRTDSRLVRDEEYRPLPDAFKDDGVSREGETVAVDGSRLEKFPEGYAPLPEGPH